MKAEALVDARGHTVAEEQAKTLTERLVKVKAETLLDANPDLFTADLATKLDKFLSIFSEEDINYKLATFTDTFLSTLDAHAPIKLIRIRSRPRPYVTPEIKD